MIRLADSKASVFTCAIVLLSASLSACSDSSSLASPEGGYDAVAETTLKRGSTSGGPGWKKDVTSVDVTPNSFSLAVGASAQLSVAALNRIGKQVDGATVRWTSSDTSVATVSNGVVRARTVGTASLVATVNGLSDTAHATVSQSETAVEAVSISPDSANLVEGESLALTAHTLSADSTELAGRTVTWSSSNSSVASVTSAGKVTALAKGSATVIATSEGKSARATVVVSTAPLVAVDSVVLSPETVKVETGDSTKLSVTLRAEDGSVLSGRTVTWASSDDGVAKVSSTGVVKGIASGKTTVTATSEGQSDAAQIEVLAEAGVVTSVSVTPASASVSTGESVQLSATPKDGAGQAVTGRTVTWASSNTSVATVSSSGQVRGVAAGTASVTATVDGVRGTSSITVAPSSTTTPPAEKVGYFVTPNGSSGNSGSSSSPWDLTSVLAGNHSLRGGDTVWVRGGTYRGQFYAYLNGAAASPVVIRQYPGERATIDGNLVVVGSNLVFWGLEVMNSNPTSIYRLGVNNRGPSNRFINMVVHDAAASGFYMGVEGSGSSVYGSVVYNNGTNGNQDHGIYANNNSPTSMIEDNIIFNNQSYGIHGYTSVSNYINNITVRGNVAFDNGLISTVGGRPDILVGGSVPATGIAIDDNYTYRIDDGMTADIGYSASNGTLTYTDNYLVGSVHMGRWASVQQSGNQVVRLSSKPTSTFVVVRPNRYEKGRANIIVYNWSHSGSVSADLSGVLSSGQRYEVRNAQDFYGAPVASGTYGGGSISIPLVAMTAVRPLGRTSNAISTGNEFGVFVVIPVD